MTYLPLHQVVKKKANEDTFEYKCMWITHNKSNYETRVGMNMNCLSVVVSCYESRLLLSSWQEIDMTGRNWTGPFLSVSANHTTPSICFSQSYSALYLFQPITQRLLSVSANHTTPICFSQSHSAFYLFHPITQLLLSLSANHTMPSISFSQSYNFSYLFQPFMQHLSVSDHRKKAYQICVIPNNSRGDCTQITNKQIWMTFTGCQSEISMASTKKDFLLSEVIWISLQLSGSHFISNTWLCCVSITVSDGDWAALTTFKLPSSSIIWNYTEKTVIFPKTV